MKGIDPKYIMYLGLLVTIEQAIGHGTVSLTNIVPASIAPYVSSWCNLLAFIGTTIMTGQAAISSSQPGPLIDAPKPSITPTIIKILFAAFLLSAFLPVGSAVAQTQRRLTGNIVNDIASSTASKSSSTLESIGAALAKPFNDIADFIGDDANGAVTLATVIPNLQDGHGQQCWIAMQSFGAVIHAHPVPITFHVLQDYETLRLLGMATNNLCANTHCTQVFADLTSMAQAASPIPLAIPSLHDLCTKVPQIAVVAPVTAPAEAAVPTK